MTLKNKMTNLDDLVLVVGETEFGRRIEQHPGYPLVRAIHSEDGGTGYPQIDMLTVLNDKILYSEIEGMCISAEIIAVEDRYLKSVANSEQPKSKFRHWTNNVLQRFIKGSYERRFRRLYEESKKNDIKGATARDILTILRSNDISLPDYIPN